MNKFLTLLFGTVSTVLVLQGCSTRPNDKDLVRIVSDDLSITNCKKVAIAEMQITNIVPGIDDNRATVEFKYKLNYSYTSQEFQDSQKQVNLESEKDIEALQQEKLEMEKQYESGTAARIVGLQTLQVKLLSIDIKHKRRQREAAEKMFSEGCKASPLKASAMFMEDFEKVTKVEAGATLDISNSLKLVKSSNGWIVDNT